MLNLKKRIDALETRRFGIEVRHCTDAQLLALTQSEEGYDLALIQGETLDEKIGAVLLAADGDLLLSPAARHAARKWFVLLERV